jgi:hypothetical protein
MMKFVIGRASEKDPEVCPCQNAQQEVHSRNGSLERVWTREINSLEELREFIRENTPPRESWDPPSIVISLEDTEDTMDILIYDDFIEG